MRDYTYSASRSRKSNRYSQHSTSREWLHILLFYVIPFIVINGIIFILVTAKPSFTFVLGDTHDYLTADIQLSVNSLLPTKDLTVTLDGEPVELETIRSRNYKFTISKNGILEMNVKAVNGMTASLFEQIDILDDTPPSVDNYSIEDGILTFTIEDSQSGMNYDSIYATDASGQTIQPASINKDTGVVTFPINGEPITVFAADLSGHESQTTFTPTGGLNAEEAEKGSTEKNGTEKEEADKKDTIVIE